MKNESILIKLNDLQFFDFSTFRMHIALILEKKEIYFWKIQIELIFFNDIFFSPIKRKNNIVSWNLLENVLNLSILLSTRKEIKWDILSNGEWKEYSSNLNLVKENCRFFISFNERRRGKFYFWIITDSVLGRLLFLWMLPLLEYIFFFAEKFVIPQKNGLNEILKFRVV